MMTSDRRSAEWRAGVNRPSPRSGNTMILSPGWVWDAENGLRSGVQRRFLGLVGRSCGCSCGCSRSLRGSLRRKLRRDH